MQGTSARWVPKHNTRHVRKLGVPTQRKERSQVARPNVRLQCKCKARLQRMARRHFRKLGATTQRNARP
jgi:hypothetical protein